MIIAVSGIFFFIFYILVANKIFFSKKIGWIMYLEVAISFAVIAYNAQPVWDLGIHFSYMGAMDAVDCNLKQIFILGIPGFRYNRFYILFNLCCLFAVKAGNYHLLPFVLVLVDYLIWGYISLDWTYEKAHSTKYMLLATLLSFTFMPYVHAMAGMRNANAACLAGLAVYYSICKKNKKVISIILMFLAVLMHPAVLIVIPIWGITQLVNQITWKYIILGLLIVFALGLIANWFLTSSNSFLQLLGELYTRYSSSEQYRNSRRYLYADLLCASFFLFVLMMNRKNVYVDDRKLAIFISIYLIYVLGNIGNYDLVIRPMYIMAPLANPLCTIAFDESMKTYTKQTAGIKFIVKVALFAIGIWVLQDYIGIIRNDFFYSG